MIVAILAELAELADVHTILGGIVTLLTG